MTDKTKIEWADSTFSPWIGCTKISPACDNCYAADMMDTRFGRVKWGPGNPRSRTSKANWREPVRWNTRADVFRECAACGWRGDLALRDKPLAFECPACDAVDWRPARRRVFCASLADVFDNEVLDAWRVDLFDLIRSTPNLDWLVLTKRIGNAVKMMDDAGGWSGVDFATGATRNPLPNVWLGATICNQAEADRDIPKLLATPAAVRFLSIEPMLAHVDLKLMARAYGFPKHITSEGRAVGMPQGIHWIICGGESGPNARPMHPDWARSLRNQCEAAGVPFLLKQWGEWLPWQEFAAAGIDDDPEITRFLTKEFDGQDWQDVGRPAWHESADGDIDDMQCVGRVGKRAAGRTLDGRTHNEFPS